MSNAITTIAVAVADAINAASLAGTLGQEVTAKRRWLPTVALEELNGIFVLVVAKAVESTPANRGSDFEDIDIDVACFVKLTGNNEETQADALFDLIEKINGAVRVISGWQHRKSEPIFDVTEMETKRVLRSATTYTFKVYHDVRL